MKRTILLLDQSEEIVNAFTKQFGELYKVESKTINNFDVKSIDQHNPYLALVIKLTDASSFNYALLKSLSATHPQLINSTIAIIESDTESTLLSCYELGVGLCIPAHRSPDLMAKKSTQLIDYKNQVNQLSQEEVTLSDLVNTTMMQSSFYGSSLDLVSELQFADSPEAMANHIYSFMQNYGINISVFFTVPDGHASFAQHSFYSNPLEQQVFELLTNKGRIYEFGNRVMFNAPNVSILIKNMPEKDSINYGLFIDVFAKLVPTVNISFNNLLNKRQLRDTQAQLVMAVEGIQNALLRSQQDRQSLLDNLVLEIGLSFHAYEFTDKQEEFLTDIIEKNVIKQTKSSEDFLNISDQLANIIQSLTHDVDDHENKTQGVNGVEQPSQNNDIELF